MADVWVPALLGAVGVLIPAVLVFIATRRRDKPTIEIAREEARTAGAQAVSEAWAEYSARMEQRLERCEKREEELQRQLDELRRKVT